MNENEVKILRRYQKTLLGALQPNLIDFANVLYQEEVIDRKECLRVIESTDERKECIRLLLILPDKCSLSTFLEVIKQCSPEYFETLQNELVKTLPFNSDVIKSPGKSNHTRCKEVGIEKFRDRLLGKVLNAEAVKHGACLREWLTRLMVNLELSDAQLPIRKRRSVADCCFVVTDALTVVERTHSPDKKMLWKSDLFTKMKRLVPDTSNPSLATLRYFARYGAALALGDKKEQGKEYVEIAMQDATRISAGRELGNCIFALVNIKLQDYRGDEKEKKSILEEIELGIHQYMEEDDETRAKWRQVYLIKKASCHLGIDLFMNDILESNITDEDISAAFKCLNEMENYSDKMDKRRKMHFLRVKSKYHYLRSKYYNQEEELCLAKGDLNAAINIGTKWGFGKEVDNMDIILECNFDEQAIQTKKKILAGRSSRQPTESYDDTEVECEQASVNDTGTTSDVQNNNMAGSPVIAVNSVRPNPDNLRENSDESHQPQARVSDVLEVIRQRLHIPTDGIVRENSNENGDDDDDDDET